MNSLGFPGSKEIHKKAVGGLVEYTTLSAIPDLPCLLELQFPGAVNWGI